MLSQYEPRTSSLIFSSCLNFKQFRARDQGVVYSTLSKAEKGHNNEWWLTEAGYAAKSLGKQPRSHSFPTAPDALQSSVNLLNLVWPQRKHKTQAIHMLPSLLQQRRPMTFLLSFWAKRSRKLLPSHCAAWISRHTTKCRGNRTDSARGPIFIPFLWAACFSLVGQRWGEIMAAGFRRTQTSCCKPNSTPPTCSGACNELRHHSSKKQKASRRSLGSS